jgi:hypothetical protein
MPPMVLALYPCGNFLLVHTQTSRCTTNNVTVLLAGVTASTSLML